MPPVRRGLNDRVQLDALEAANQRAPQQLRVAPPAKAAGPTEPNATEPDATEPQAAEPEVTDQERDVSEQVSRAASDPVEKVLWAALVAAKTTTIAFGIDALLHAN